LHRRGVFRHLFRYRKFILIKRIRAQIAFLPLIACDDAAQVVEVFQQFWPRRAADFDVIERDFLPGGFHRRVNIKLAAALTTQRSPNGRPLNVITTGFHINEVRATVSALPEHLAVNLDVLITNMSPETRRKIDALGRDARLGFICRDQESAQLYRDLLRIELENEALNLTCCTLAETAQVRKLYKTADLLLVSPPVYEEVRKAAPSKLPVFNVFDRVDPMSLRVIKDRLSSQKQPLTN
jgi:hypothetical protein